MQKAYVLVVGFLVLAFSSLAQTDYRFRHFGVSDGMAAEFATTMVQDSMGFLWIKYHGGLTRYDGYEFRTYKDESDTTLTSPRMSRDGQLLLSPNGTVWTVNNQRPLPDHRLIISRYDQALDGFVKYFPDLGGRIVTAVGFEKESPVLWLGTSDASLYRFDYATVSTEQVPIENYPKMQVISGIADDDTSLLLASNDGLWTYDKQAKIIRRPACSPADTAFLYHSFFNFIRAQTPGANGLWLRSANTLARITISADGLRIEHRYDVPEHIGPIEIHCDTDGVLWLPTQNLGLFRYDPGQRNLTNIRRSADNPFGLKTDRVNSALVDRDGNLWVSTSQFGIARHSKQGLQFYNTHVGPGVSAFLGYSLHGEDFVIICRIPPDKPEINELMLARVGKDHRGPLKFETLKSSPMMKGGANTMWRGKSRLLIGTIGNGVLEMTLNQTTGMPEPERSRLYHHDPANPNTISTNNTNGVWEDKTGNIWLGTQGLGLCMIDPQVPYGQPGSVKFVRAGGQQSLSNDAISKEFYGDVNEDFWVITMSGFELYHNGSFKLLFPDDHPMTIHKGVDQNLYLGTWSGLYRQHDAERHLFTPVLEGEVTYAFENDKLGRFWVTDDIRLLCYDAGTKGSVSFTQAEGFDHSRDNTYSTTQGLIVTSDVDGVSIFDPMEFHSDTTTREPVLTQLLINNNVPAIGSSREEFTIEKDITALDHLVLDWRHNNFSIAYSAMDFVTPENNQYRHKLDGFEKDWITTKWRNRTATYTNLNAGDYTFRVKASSRHGIWSEKERTVAITVLPPPWQTSWAYASYSVICALLLGTGAFMIRQRERLKARIRIDRFELEKVKEIDKAKTAFFTNISHEFRTPLTLITGPVQELEQRFSKNTEVLAKLNLIKGNADGLLRLVQQLLDLAKLEAGNDKVNFSSVDLLGFVHNIVQPFSSLARKKEIDLLVALPEVSCSVPIDIDKVGKVLTNLLANAVKFTPASGRIEVIIEVREQSELVFTVRDNGIGIPEEYQEKIFDRFFRVADARVHQEVGTGIGLSLVRELMVLMKGTVHVSSQPGAGSEFIVRLPLEWVKPLEVAESLPAEDVAIEEQQSDTSVEQSADGRCRILVVEDHADLRKFIISSLGNGYEFLEASNGREGIDVALEEIPDLVITDLMMPEVDGIQLTEKLKCDIRTSHVPLIILTAKATRESLKEGLGAGADDYLVKPFDVAELTMKVKNVIQSRKNLSRQIRLEMLNDHHHDKVLSLDEKFIVRLRECVSSQLGNEDLSVDLLAREVGLSRAQLYRKVAALTTMTVNDFIQMHRLEKAASLLTQRWGTVAQVAYEVGFSNPSYFSKCFRERFGKLPSQYP